ncbi:MCE family protein [Streptomyces sp. MAR4 CNX-425]|uniref:MCE family protein n=1 Tax=Streptomyces sp. MAR4 CNX-425 TaxID=3406343 RepID=UPI003B50259F
MITRSVIVKNIVFAVVAVLVIGYVGVRYADLGRYVGMRDYYTVRVELAETGGLFTHAAVTYRGVSVGRVGPIELTDTGVEAELRIRDSAPPIPADLSADVANYSAVGEQYLDLKPTADSGPYLTDGDVVGRQHTSTPAPVTNLLTSVDSFATSVDTRELRTVVDELGDAFAGQGENLRRLLDTGSEFVRAADDALPYSTRLMIDGETVLRTQNESGEALKAFADGAEELAHQLERSDGDLRRVIEAGPGAASQVTGLLRDLDPSLSVLLANLLTTSDIAVTRQDGLEQLLVQLPQVTAAGSTAITPDGARFGLALSFFNPLPCTQGYGSTTYRNGLKTSPASFNTAARCTAPASSGVNVRGSAHSPGGGEVPTPARPGSGLADDRPGTRAATGALPGALGLPSVGDGPRDMAGLLGLEEAR